MFKKLFALLLFIVMIGCSSNPVSVEKASTFNLKDYNSFVVVISDKSEDVKVSPFTNVGFKKEFSERFKSLGLSENSENPDFKAVISLSVESKNKRRSARRYPYYYYDPFYDDIGYGERSVIRLTLYDTKNGEPVWTGLRSTQYVDKELKLDQEQIAKYVESLLSELTS